MTTHYDFCSSARAVVNCFRNFYLWGTNDNRLSLLYVNVPVVNCFRNFYLWGTNDNWADCSWWYYYVVNCFRNFYLWGTNDNPDVHNALINSVLWRCWWNKKIWQICRIFYLYMRFSDSVRNLRPSKTGRSLGASIVLCKPWAHPSALCNVDWPLMCLVGIDRWPLSTHVIHMYIVCYVSALRGL